MEWVHPTSVLQPTPCCILEVTAYQDSMSVIKATLKCRIILILYCGARTGEWSKSVFLPSERLQDGVSIT